MTEYEIRELAIERFGNHPHVFGGQRDGFIEGFKKAMEIVKNNGVLPLVSDTVCPRCKSKELSRKPVTYDCHDCGATWQTGR